MSYTMCVKQPITDTKFLNFILSINSCSLFFTIFLIMSCSNHTEEVPLEKGILVAAEIEKRNSESCLSSDDIDPDECQFQELSFLASLDDYPGCWFNVQISYFKCVTLNSIDETFYIQNVSLISHNCPDFDNDVLLAQQNGTLAEFTLHFDVMLFEAARNALGSNPPNLAAYTYIYLTASCNQYCWITGSKNGFTYYTYHKVPCGEGCCQIESVYYYDDGIVVSETTDITNTGDVGNCIIENACAAPGVVFSSKCIFTCDAYL